MRDYGKVYSTFWSSATTGSLSDDGKLLAMYLMTCSHSTITGVYRLPDGYVSEDLGWASARVAKGFAELLSKGFANRCETTKWVWICKHLEWNKPENPNQRKSASKIALSIPDECGWKLDFMRVCGPSLEISWSPEDNPSGTLAQPLLNQKQEQKQEQDTSGKDGNPSGKPSAEKSKAQLWKAAVSLLEGQGMPEAQARTYIGRLSKDYPDGDIVMKAVEGAVSEQPADARAYLKAACQRMNGERKRDGGADWTANAL